MSARDTTRPDPASHKPGEAHIKPRDYVIGFLLSVVLTAIPFWLVMAGVLPPRMTGILITLFAIAQIVVHTIFFLHVNTRSEGGWTLLALVFTGIIVVIVILGSLWIMYHLHGNMMPMAPPPVPVATGVPVV